MSAERKLTAMETRRDPGTRAEKPKEAIRDALDRVADAIAMDGFVFAPSGPHFVRKASDFTFVVSVQADHNNVAARRAAIWVFAVAYSKKLNAWRKAHAGDWVRLRTSRAAPFFTSQLGYLRSPASWAEWDFADKSQRRATVDELIASLQASAFPLFDTLEGSIQEVAAIAEKDLTKTEGILSYLLSSGHGELAEKVLDDYLGRKPSVKHRFAELLAQFSVEGAPPYRGADAHDLAAFAAATGYPWRRTI